MDKKKGNTAFVFLDLNNSGAGNTRVGWGAQCGLTLICIYYVQFRSYINVSACQHQVPKVCTPPPPLALLNLEINTNTFRLVKMSM